MTALTNLRSTAPPRAAEINSQGFKQVEAHAPDVSLARLVGRWTCAPDSRKPTCAWEVVETGSAGRRSSDWRRAA